MVQRSTPGMSPRRGLLDDAPPVLTEEVFGT
jgi:hypothetical protein